MSNKFVRAALAVCLVIGFIFAAEYLITESFFPSGKNEIKPDETVILEDKEIKDISVNLISADLLIEKGDSFSVVTDSEYITYTLNKSKLSVIEKTHSPGTFGGKVTVYIPDDSVFDRFDIDTGKGNIDAYKIACDEMDLDYGAGSVGIGSLLISSKGKIDGGAGKITVSDGRTNNLDVDLGVGDLNLRSALSGETKIDTGVGKTTLTLLGGKDLYSFDIDRAAGMIELDGVNVDDGYFGSGGNLVEIDGGVGSITVNFE